MELLRFMFESGWHFAGVLVTVVIVAVCLDILVTAVGRAFRRSPR